MRKSATSVIRKAVVLAGGHTTLVAPLTNYCPSYRVPVLNRPLIEHTVEFLEKSGIQEVIIAVSSEDMFAGRPETDHGEGIRVRYHQEKTPRGTAGCLKDLERSIGGEPFLVLNGSLFIRSMELASFLRHHEHEDSMLTIGIFREENGGGPTERISIAPDGSGKGFSIVGSATHGRLSWRMAGMYLFDPSVLAFIDPNQYMDIKEQLIPLLQQKSVNLSTYEIRGDYRHISSVRDYIRINRELLIHATGDHFGRKSEIAREVWVGKDVTISPGAYIVGPVVIGDHCRIEDSAQIIGPAVIANDCTIAEGVLFRESILWEGVSVSDGARVEYSIVGANASIPEQYQLKHTIAMNGMKTGDMNLVPEYLVKGTIDLSRSSQVSRTLYRVVKRTMDIALSSAGLLLLLPVFLIIALMIKIDSSGPVFYIQKRCGLQGRLFGMIKFRTMVEDAEKMHTALLNQKNTDGPMFKLLDDPRITKLGKILRRSSIDELPQLLNVIKGEMSLVGPRPLITEEMKFSPSWRDIRLKVKPGITGLWQVQGRSKAHFHDWIRFDVFYVKSQSFWLDIKILFKTISAVLKKVGAY